VVVKKRVTPVVEALPPHSAAEEEQLHSGTQRIARSVPLAEDAIEADHHIDAVRHVSAAPPSHRRAALVREALRRQSAANLTVPPKDDD
jgi:hypothetical protein